MKISTGIFSLVFSLMCVVMVSEKAMAEPSLSMFGMPNVDLRAGSDFVSAPDIEPGGHGVQRQGDVIMETYGDSVTAGFLSNTTAMGTETLASVSKIMSDLAMFVASGDRKYIDGHEDRNAAWPAVLAKMLEKDGHRLIVKNMAVSGAITRDIFNQVNGGPKDIDGGTAFFFIGHNDLCETPFGPEALADHYESDFEPGLVAWDRNHKNSTAYFVRVGDVQRVFNTMKGHVWYQGKGHPYTCEDSWQRFFPYCRYYQKKLADGTLDAYLTPRINAMNSRLPDIAAKWDKKSANKNHYVFVDDTTDSPYEKTFFAVDCYHLSPVGQRRLAEGIYKQITK